MCRLPEVGVPNGSKSTSPLNYLFVELFVIITVNPGYDDTGYKRYPGLSDSLPRGIIYFLKQITI